MSAEISYLDVEAAERRVERMRFHATAMNDSAQNLLKVMHQAREFDDHLTLGYASWPALLLDVFGNEPLRLTREARRELVAEMSDAGMSTRAIAPLVGVSKSQVAADIEVSSSGQVDAGAEKSAPGPVETEGFTVNPSTGEVIDGPTITAEPVTTEHTVTEKIKTVTGLDGKEYKRPELKQIPRGDEANRLNAIQASKSIGRSLEALQYLNYEKARTGIVTDWWPVGKHEVPPEQANYFTPAELRKLAQGLNETADLLEAHHVH